VSTEDILKEIETQAKVESLPIIGPKKAEVLAELIKKYQPKRVLEIGTLVGYSTIVIASNLPAGGKVTSIEIDPHDARAAQENFKKAEVQSQVEIRIGNALDIIPMLDGQFDFLFIDASKIYLQFLKLVESRLSANAVVVADNVKIFDTQMKDYLDYVRESGKFDSQMVVIDDDALEVSLKKS
jgi:predicted O-methyltransferase YrrM